MTPLSTDLVLPRPTGNPEQLARACEAIIPRIDSIDDIDTANELRRRAVAIETYLDSKRAPTAEAQTAARLLEARVGYLAGPAPGKGRGDSISDASDITDEERWRLRLLAEWIDRWKPALPCSQAEALRIAKIARREATTARAGTADDYTDNEQITLWHGDFRERTADIPDSTIDLIITDPPYPKDDLPLYTDLAKHAARILGPRGILFAWTGQIFLPEVLNRLAQHLNYGWTFALELPGAGSRIMGRHIIQAWKPIVAFTPRTWPSGEWGDDVLISPSREKTRDGIDFAPWEQNAAPARRLIERYAPPDALILDPFMGTGTFGIAAQHTGRRFIGVELDAKRFNQARERLQ